MVNHFDFFGEERGVPVEQLEGEDSEREDVSHVVVALLADNFWRKVVGRPAEGLVEPFDVVHFLAETEVAHADVASLVDEDVFCLDNLELPSGLGRSRLCGAGSPARSPLVQSLLGRPLRGSIRTSAGG